MEKKKIKRIFKYLGLLCIMAALLLTGFNLFTDFYYGNKASTTVNEFVEIIQNETILEEEITIEDLKYQNLTSVEIDGNRYVGIIEMPTVDLVLPVLKDATQESLNIGPGVYVGTPYDINFVIGAHNRISFFNKILDLKIGDHVYFMDATRNIFEYEVARHDIIPPENVDEMIYSNYDLSLFTCNYSNTMRETIRLNKVSTQLNNN